jgi:hypothetical protein
MADTDSVITIGNVLRADIRGFVVASRIPEPDVPTFGTFVRAAIQQARADLIGLVYNITLQDDPFLKNLAVTVIEDDPRYAEIIRDQQENRAIPVEIAVAAIGYRDEDSNYHYGLPPQPPMILHRITVCSKDEVRHITAAPDFMRALFDNRDVPADELIPTALQRAARLRPETMRAAFFLEAGRYLAQYLGRDPVRLERILRRLA